MVLEYNGEDKLCSVCQDLDLDQADSQEGYTLHSDLADLKQCATSCRLCDFAYGDICNMQQEVNAHLPDELLNQYKAVLLLGVSEPPDRQNCTIDGSLGLFVHGLGRDEKIFVRAWRRFWIEHCGLGGRLRGSKILSVGRDTSSDQTLSKARFWLNRCVRGDCPGSKTQVGKPSGRAPSRLIEAIDFVTGRLRLVDSSNFQQPYVALSYTWGSDLSPWKTTKANLGSRMSQLCLSELPRTLADAVRIAFKIGVPHIWIDSLCIVQDDSRDWEVEASNMIHVYTNAVVTIAADCSKDSTSGIFNARSRTHFDGWKPNLIWRGVFKGCRCTLSIDTFGPLSHWHKYIAEGHPQSRGWCCQEFLLSPRILHFTETQLFWECLHCFESEDSYSYDDSSDRKRAIRRVFLEQGQASMSSTSMKRLVKRHWYLDIISADYSSRSLTHASDKLIAIAGIAKAIHQMSGMRYHAGIWDFEVVEGLAWRRMWNYPGGKAKKYRAPSWSWASQDSKVAHYLLDDEDGGSLVTERAELIDIDVQTSTGDDFGLVRNGSVTLRARAVKGRCVSWEADLWSDNVLPKSRPRTRLQLAGPVIPAVVLIARMDSEYDEECEREVMVLQLLRLREESFVVFLLLAPNSTTPDTWIRIGQAEPILQHPDQIIAPQLLLDKFEGTEQYFTIV